MISVEDFDLSSEEKLKVMLLRSISMSCYDGTMGLVHNHDREYKEIFHYLESEGILVSNYPDTFWSFDVTEDWQKYVWFYA